MVMLIDGQGNAKNKIDSRNNLWTQARVLHQRAMVCMEGNYYILTSGRKAITATGGDVLYFKFTETEKIMVLDFVRFYWNGGNTNFNRPCQVDLKSIASIGTLGNHTVSQAYNMNTGSSQTVSMTVYQWDGVGDGITGITTSYTRSYGLAGPGLTKDEYDGVMVMPPNSEIVFSAVPHEVGDLIIDVGFFVVDPLVDSYANL